MTTKRKSASRDTSSYFWFEQTSKRTFVQEREVLLDHGEERDDGRLHALAAQDVAVLGHVARRVKDVLQVPKSLSYLPGSFSHELRRRATGAKFRPLNGGQILNSVQLVDVGIPALSSSIF